MSNCYLSSVLIVMEYHCANCWWWTWCIIRDVLVVWRAVSTWAFWLGTQNGMKRCSQVTCQLVGWMLRKSQATSLPIGWLQFDSLGTFPVIFVATKAGRLSKVKPWCFLNPNQVVFVPKPNQTISTVLWWEKQKNSTEANISSVTGLVSVSWRFTSRPRQL